MTDTTKNLQPATITTAHWRGTYVAKLEVDDNGRFSREFQEITLLERGAKGTPSRRCYEVAPGWYESREGYRMHQGQPTVKSYWAASAHGVREMTLSDVVNGINGPTPGTPGAYGSETCLCGSELVGYTHDGFPYCGEHEPTVSVSEDIGVPL